MKLKLFSLVAALMFAGTANLFAAKADHNSATGVATSLLKSIRTDDFECFNDTFTPQSQAFIAAQEDPQRLFKDFSKGIRKVLEQVPEEQRPLVNMLLISQFQKIAVQIDGKWYFDAGTLMGSQQ
ncbi:MAG: hypothetical protein MJ033_03300 [Victivallaceae bacterium]|nr:hypothetical protein [Victivallaceae bacterium]